MSETGEIVHASAVSFGSAGVLIRGGSGVGKSGLALELIGLGAELIGDDGVMVCPKGGHMLCLSRPKTLPPLIEARNVGLLRAPMKRGSAVLRLIVELGTTETERLPPARQARVMGVDIPMLHNCAARYFPSAIKAYLTWGKAPA